MQAGEFINCRIFYFTPFKGMDGFFDKMFYF